VLVLFDSDVIAEHRIEEIEALEASGRVDADLYDDARAALSELGEDHPLWQRLAAASPADDGAGEEVVSDDDDRSEVDTGVVVALTLPDGSEARMTLAGEELVNIDAPVGWTVTEIDDDEATLESDDYIVEVEVASDGSVDVAVTAREADDDESESTTQTTSITDASDDDESSDVEVTSTTENREDDSDSAEADSSGDEREDDDASDLP
jgi:hypothetical protein